jgi:hypothetical protein
LSTTIKRAAGTTASTASTGMLRRRHPVRTTRVSALCSSADPTTFSTVPFSGPLTRKPSHCASQYRATGLDLSNRLSLRD